MAGEEDTSSSFAPPPPPPPPPKMISSNDAVACNWVIETLADQKGVDTSVLKAVMSIAPNFYADAPETVRDRVSLRFLEECTGGVRDGAGEIPSPPRSPIDVSRSCEEVLCSHLRKMRNSSNMQKDRFETCINGIRQFILQKKASMPKVSLDVLNGSILEGKHPALSSFLERSGLIRHEQEDLLESNIDGEHERVKRLRFSTYDNAMEISQKDPSGSVQHLLNQHVPDSDRTDHLQKDSVDVEGNKIQSLERNGTLEPPGKENTNLDGGESRLSAQTAVTLIPNNCTQISQNDVSAPHGNSTVLPKSPLDECGKNLIPTCPEKDQYNGKTVGLPATSSDDDSEDACFEPADEMFAAEKHHLLSSQAKNNQDSISGDWTEHDLCIKCGNGGQLLTCSVSGCLVAVHESCLGTVRFDKAGLFYCPFCTYSRATVAYCKARKSVCRARKNLSTFLGKNIGQRRTNQARVVENNQLDDVSYQHSTGSLNGNSSRAEHHEQTEVTKFSRQAEKRVSVGRCDDSTNVVKVNDEQIVDEAATTVEGADTIFMNEQVEDLQPAEPHTALDNGSLPCKDANTSHGEHDAAVVQKKAETSAVDDHRNTQEPNSDEQVKETSDDDTGDEAMPSGNSGRHHKRAQEADPETVENGKGFKSSPGKRRKHPYQAKRYSNPLMPPGRRAKLPWNPEEEAILKEGVEKFAANDGGSIPWRKIRVFGCRVFHKTRQPGDLKDKWRNIKIKEGRER